MEAAHTDPPRPRAGLCALAEHVVALTKTLQTRGPEQARAQAEADGTRRLHNIYELAARKKEIDLEQVVERYRAAATANFLEDEKLIEGTGDQWLSDHAPGKQVGIAYLIGYLKIARYIPEEIVVKGLGSHNLYEAIVAVESPRCRALLISLLEKETSREKLNRAAEAAKEAEDLALPEGRPQRHGHRAAAPV